MGRFPDRNQSFGNRQAGNFGRGRGRGRGNFNKNQQFGNRQQAGKFGSSSRDSSNEMFGDRNSGKFGAPRGRGRGGFSNKNQQFGNRQAGNFGASPDKFSYRNNQQLGSGNRQSDNFANKQPGMFQKTVSPKNVQTSNTNDHKSSLNKKATQQEKEKLKFDESSENEEDEEITDEEDLIDEFGSSEEDEMESEEEEENQVSQSPKEKKQQLASRIQQKEKLQSGKMTNGKLGLKMAEKKQPELKTTKQEKEKLKFDESSGEDEEMTDEEDMMDEFGSSEEDEMESEEEAEKQISQNNKQLKNTQSQDGKKMVSPKEKFQLQLSSKGKLDLKKEPNELTKKVIKQEKEELKFDESSGDEDEEISDEEGMDEFGSSEEDEDELESDEEEDDHDQKKIKMEILSPQKQLKRKLPEEVTPKQEQNKKLRVKLENDDDEKIGQKIEQQAKEKAIKVEPNKQSKEEQKKKKEAIHQIPQISPKKTKAIIAEEERRRAERNKRSIFLKSEMFAKMKPGELKALHSDAVSVRQHFQVCWLMFPSESSAKKAYAELSKTKKLGGKELFVDYCAQHKDPVKSAKKDKRDYPINPVELVISNAPASTTQDQLKVLFPAAEKFRVVNKASGSQKLDRTNSHVPAFITFSNEADAKKAFEKSGQPQLKIAGEPVDVFYGRLNPKK